MKSLGPLCTAAALFFLVPAPFIHADIATDGSLGAASTLSGPDYQIDASLGSVSGTNLFHSFEYFSLSAGDSATFTGPANINHVISRVTGGMPSTIDGNLQDNFSQANFYFINPAGIIFGANASLNVSGSLFVSTADYIRLSDGNRFIATSPADGVILTTAPPQAFGFMDNNIAAVTAQGSWFNVAENHRLAIVGGDIILSNVLIESQKSSIQLASAATIGEIIITGDHLDTEQIARLGQVQLTDSQLNTVGANGAGDIAIRAGKLVLDNSSVFSYTTGTANAGNLSIDSDVIDISNATIISTETFGAGDAGAITLNADAITITDDSALFTGTYNTGNAGTVTLNADAITTTNGSIIYTGTFGAGNAGAVTLNADVITTTNGSTIDTRTFGAGDAGAVTLNADAITTTNGSTIDTGTFGAGDAGAVTLNTDTTTITSGSAIYTGTEDAGNAGAVTLNAESITITDDSTINTGTFGAGDAGAVTLNTGTITITDGSTIYTGTSAQGSGGDVTIQANSVELSGESATQTDVVSAIQTIAKTGSVGNAGDIIIEANSLALINGGELRTQSLSDADAGNIQLQLNDNLVLRGETSDGLTSRIIASAGNRAVVGFAANAGEISITTDTMAITNGGLVLARNYGSGNGGTIAINAISDVLISGNNQPKDINRSQHSIIGTEANINGGTGHAGNIVISAQNLSITDGAFVRTDAFDQGNAGDLHIDLSGSLIMQGLAEINNQFFNTFISSNTTDGTGGTITINAKDAQLIDSAQIQTVTFGTGDAGNIIVNTQGELLISKDNPFTGSLSGLYSIGNADEETQSSGQAGDISISAGALTISNGGAIWSNAFGTGKGGNIHINVAGTLEIAGNASSQIQDIYIAGQGGQIASSTNQSGNAGHIVINTHDLILKDGARLFSTTLGSGRAGNINVTATNIVLTGEDNSIGSNPSGIVAETSNGTGNGGNINIAVATLLLDEKGVVSSSSSGNGLAGNITINATDWIALDSGASISASATQSDGGNMIINAISKLWLKDSQITTSVGAGQGNGGNIRIDPEFVILDNSTIRANAFGGSGGNIFIAANQFIASPDSVVEAVAKANPGIDGRVVIDSPDRDISGQLARPQLAFFDTQAVLSGPCSLPTADSLIKLRVTPTNTLFTSMPQALRVLDIQSNSGTLAYKKTTYKTTAKNFLDDALLHNEIDCLNIP